MDSRMRRTPPGVTQLDIVGGFRVAAQLREQKWRVEKGGRVFKCKRRQNHSANSCHRGKSNSAHYTEET